MTRQRDDPWRRFQEHGGPQTFTRPVAGDWAAQLLNFTTTTTETYRIEVSSASAYLTHVDNFALTAVPEPTSLGLLGLGSLMLRRRRR